MTTQGSERDWLAELAIGHCLGELSPEEAVEYAALRHRHRHGDALESESQRVVAAALEAALGSLVPLPAALADRIASDASHRMAGTAPEKLLLRKRKISDRVVAYGGWLAAAASLLVVWSVWRTPPASAPPVALAPSAERAMLLASGRTLLKGEWSAGGDALGLAVKGDVVWDPVQQTGYMRFTGLAVNNPSREQYQLWIFDKQRDQRYPVDGGTFDVNADGEVVITIHAKLPVDSATLFAVTVERPGGVVVSARERMAAVAHAG
jgi:anti-sigma-K factor RskA